METALVHKIVFLLKLKRLKRSDIQSHVTFIKDSTEHAVFALITCCSQKSLTLIKVILVQKAGCFSVTFIQRNNNNNNKTFLNSYQYSCPHLQHYQKRKKKKVIQFQEELFVILYSVFPIVPVKFCKALFSDQICWLLIREIM